MDEARDSDLLEAQLDLIDMSEIDDNQQQTVNENESIRQTSTLSSRGFCVKEYEEKMDNLKKENFNLKFKLYLLEQNNITLPEGMENFQKQFIEIKVENETLRTDLKEKQDLLHQASIALELLEEEKSNCQIKSDVVIEELKDKIKSLEQERSNLQTALNDLNKSNLGNDTGYADFLGAVDMRDIEMQRKLLEMSQVSDEYRQQVAAMSQEIQNLKSLLKDSESKISMLQYERDEWSDKYKNSEADSKFSLQKCSLIQKLLSETNQDLQFLQNQNDRFFKKIEMLNEKCEALEFLNFQLSMKDQENQDIGCIMEVENELREFKEKWAATQCELLDLEAKYKESDEERKKTISYLTKCLETLDEERQKIAAMEEILAQQHQSAGIAKNDTKKDEEISKLRANYENAERKLRELTASELKEKNQEIEKLTQIINEMKTSGNKSISETPRFSFDYLYESFNDLKFQQAMEIKKQSQKKVNELIQELIGLANSKTKDPVNQLREQLAIVVEKQEIADDALNRCAELCSYTLDHLHELAQFLTALLQNKEIRESLSNKSLLDIQSILDKSIEFSRYSIDGRNSALPDISILGTLLNSARDSIANIREKQIEISKADKSIQMMEECENCLNLDDKLQLCREECDELKKVNQLLEDEICEYREIIQLRNAEIQKCNDDIQKCKAEIQKSHQQIQDRDEQLQDWNEQMQQNNEQIQKCKEEIEYLKQSECEIGALLEDSQKKILSLQVEKINATSKFESSQETVQKLEKRLKEIEEDLNANWITKDHHEDCLNKVKEEVVNAESQTAAIRIELEELRNMYPKYKLASQRSSILDDCKENDENAMPNNLQLMEGQVDATTEAGSSQTMTKLEYADENRHVVISTESNSCRHCPKYQGQIRELKKYLQASLDKIKSYSDQKAVFDRHVQKQLNKTENFLQQARSNMENIMKNKENKK